MSYQIDVDYTQVFIFPPSLEDFIGKDDPVRFIRAFVDSLDLKRMGFNERDTNDGRPGFAPSSGGNSGRTARACAHQPEHQGAGYTVYQRIRDMGESPGEIFPIQQAKAPVSGKAVIPPYRKHTPIPYRLGIIFRVHHSCISVVLIDSSPFTDDHRNPVFNEFITDPVPFRITIGFVLIASLGIYARIFHWKRVRPVGVL